MVTITIPRELIGKGDLVLILRREYEKLLGAVKGETKNETPNDFVATIRTARRDYERGNFKTHKSARGLIAELRS